MRRSNQLRYEATDVGIWSFVGFITARIIASLDMVLLLLIVNFRRLRLYLQNASYDMLTACSVGHYVDESV